MRIPQDHAAFTLLELLVSALIATVTLGVLLEGLVNHVYLTDAATNRVTYQLAVNRYIEDLRRPDFFDTLWNLAAGTTQHLPSPGAGEPSFVTLSGTTGELLVRYSRVAGLANGQAVEVTLDPIWREGKNRIIGEDANLNGILDDGEDRNSNGWLDSPVQITIRVARQTLS